MFIDTHCHIDKIGSKEYVENSLNNNVGIIINASENLDTSLEGIEISNNFDNVFTCVGVHPRNVSDFEDNIIDSFHKMIKHDKVKSIGEIGLDYYYSKDNKERQKEVFRMFLSLAEEYNYPVVIHSREATGDTLDILKDYNVNGIIHCFSGSLETAKEYISRGFLIGIGGVLTFKNSRLYEVLKDIPLAYIVLETDAPFLTPEPYRKYKNESKYIPVIAECVSKYKNVSIEEVMSITTENARRIFDI